MNIKEVNQAIKEAYKRHPGYHMEVMIFAGRVEALNYFLFDHVGTKTELSRAEQLIGYIREENPEDYHRDPELFLELREIAEKWFSDVEKKCKGVA